MLVSLAAGLLLFRFDDARITEASGLAVACPSGLVLTHNDSGDTARFFAVDRHGRTVATYSLRGADAVDWEDMARDGDRLYLADIGDNARSRDHVDVYETAVPDGSGPTTLVATRHRLRYPDGAHDAEALLVRDGRIFVVVKSGDGAVYAAPDSGDGTMRKVATSGLTLVTGGDVSPDGRQLVLRTYGDAFVWDVDGSVPAAFDASPRRVDLPSERQGEAVTYDCDGHRLLVTSEGLHEAVYAVPLAPPASSSAAPAAGASPSPAARPATGGLGPAGWAAIAAASALTVAVVSWLAARRRRP